jgi:hypothetical protein
MGWERGYYYRSRKVGGRVVRQYVGKGRAALLAARLDAAERAKRQAQADAWREERARLDALDAEVEALAAVTDGLVRAALQAAGLHEHKGQWRRKRHGDAAGAEGARREAIEGSAPPGPGRG